MGKVLLVVLTLGLVIFAIIDIATTPRREVPVMPKWLWLLAVLVPLAGPLAWLVASRRDRWARPEGPAAGPDDDPDFLRGLKPRRPSPTDDSVQRWEEELRGDSDADR